MVSHKIAPSIATNNCMVCKPTELTPLTCLALADILYEAGLPPEMFQVVTGLPQDIGDEMITNENIDIITFTGGVPVGKIIASKGVYKRQALELGRERPADHPATTSPMPISTRPRRLRWRVQPAIPASAARRSSASSCRKAWPTAFVPLVLEKAKKIKFGDPHGPGDRAWLRDPFAGGRTV